MKLWSIHVCVSQCSMTTSRKHNITCTIHVPMRNYYSILTKIKKRGNNNSISLFSQYNTWSPASTHSNPNITVFGLNIHHNFFGRWPNWLESREICSVGHDANVVHFWITHLFSCQDGFHSKFLSSLNSYEIVLQYWLRFHKWICNNQKLLII